MYMFSHAEVSQLDFAIRIYQNVCPFDVPARKTTIFNNPKETNKAAIPGINYLGTIIDTQIPVHCIPSM